MAKSPDSAWMQAVNDRNAMVHFLSRIWPWLLVGIPAMILFRDYVRTDFNLILCAIALPFAAGFRTRKKRVEWRYAIGAIVFLALHLVLGIKFPLLFGVGFLLLFVAENQFGRLNVLPVWLLFLVSPVQVYLSEVLGASLRLQLSEWAGKALHLMGMEVVTAGNKFVLEGQAFYVDPACAGLDMLLTASIFAIIFAGYQEMKQGRKLSWVVSGLLMSWTLGCVILANLVRMIGIVWLKAAPETAMHEAIGLISLIAYALIPIWIGAWICARWLAKPAERIPVKAGALSPAAGGMVLALSAVLIFFVLRPVPEIHVAGGESRPSLPGFVHKSADLGVTGLLGPQSLVYVKPPAPFWGADHSPAICWRAEGYALRGEAQQLACGMRIWVAELHRENEVLYTAWWYENGVERVSSQWDWRWKTAKGDPPFRLINVTVDREADLIGEAENVMRDLRFE